MTSRERDPLPLLAAAIAAQVIGALVTQLSPLIVGGVIHGLSLTEQQAGNLVFAEFLALSIAAIGIAPVLPRISMRRLCLWAAAVVVLADAATLFTVSLPTVVSLRVIAGFGAGLIYAASLAAVASRSVNPDRVYGLFQITWAAGSIVLFTVGGQLTDSYAQRGIFGLVTVLTLLLAPLLNWLPDRTAEPARSIRSDAAAAPAVMGVVTFGGVFIYLVATAAIYTFTEPLGRRAGLGTVEIGYLLTVGAVVGLSGAVLATWLNVRRGRALPVCIFSAAFAVVAVVMCLNTHPWVYGVCLVLTIIFFYFSVPYLFGLAAALDGQGRWAAAAGSAYLLGFAVGPAFAGWIIDWSGYPGLGFSAAAATFAAWALLMITVRYLAGSERPAAMEIPASDSA